MTIKDLLARGADTLRQAGIDTPMRDAELLLGHIMDVPSSHLFGHGNEDATNEHTDQFRTLISRRSAHEPLAYLLETQPFCDRLFRVSKHTLIPRPETETLVDLAIDCLDTGEKATRFADIGTGSGIIAITLAARTHVPVIATDISEPALAIAKENARTHGVTHNIMFLHGNSLEPIVNAYQKTVSTLAQDERLIICANLPYLTKEQHASTDPGVREFEPETALVSGEDGLDHYQNLLSAIKQHRQVLPHCIDLLCEIDPSQSRSLPKQIINIFPNTHPTVQKDLFERDRVVHVQL